MDRPLVARIDYIRLRGNEFHLESLCRGLHVRVGRLCQIEEEGLTTVHQQKLKNITRY